MAGLVAAIYVFLTFHEEVDARHKAGRDDVIYPKYASRTSGRLASSCDVPDATTRPFDST